jgi:putative PIN family toxin of toxin-antitoxin system
MKPTVVDTGVFVAGVFWRHEPHACLKAWLAGLICPVVSREIFNEYERVLYEVKTKESFDTEIEPWLEAMRTSALWVTPVKLREPVCRDRQDNKFIEAALAAGARTLIARDADLTVLEKPFGVEILTPRAWLARLPRAQRRLLDAKSS